MTTRHMLRGSRRAWILVVDADEVAAESLARHFRALGFGAHAACGSDAGSAADQPGPTLAVIDVGLPDTGGLETARRLRARDPELLLVITTSDFDAAVEIEARKLGIVYYAQKPLDYEQLDAVAAKALHARGAVLP